MWLLDETGFRRQLASESIEGLLNYLYCTIGGRPYGGACLPNDVKGLLISFTKKLIFLWIC
ncbi:MAG: hypothetical protein ABJB76_02245 [Candidatus Nitrosocosmicus sp.]